MSHKTVIQGLYYKNRGKMVISKGFDCRMSTFMTLVHWEHIMTEKSVEGGGIKRQGKR